MASVVDELEIRNSSPFRKSRSDDSNRLFMESCALLSSSEINLDKVREIVDMLLEEVLEARWLMKTSFSVPVDDPLVCESILSPRKQPPAGGQEYSFKQAKVNVIWEYGLYSAR